ncbi:hypothetical protein B0T16DRAFT_459018 [Cercophora newfieldiana]|uniref:Uncharacterized protein n=1 Tax=Cercophora newfieldiana TaxID=92897 RepID=A0AA39Y6X3_9PEZI|nr:hypothetical protein B0T16DRAFT_459018 [Cercophora newfieldiana]
MVKQKLPRWLHRPTPDWPYNFPPPPRRSPGPPRRPQPRNNNSQRVGPSPLNPNLHFSEEQHTSHPYGHGHNSTLFPSLNRCQCADCQQAYQLEPPTRLQQAQVLHASLKFVLYSTRNTLAGLYPMQFSSFEDAALGDVWNRLFTLCNNAEKTILCLEGNETVTLGEGRTEAYGEFDDFEMELRCFKLAERVKIAERMESICDELERIYTGRNHLMQVEVMKMELLDGVNKLAALDF